MIRKPYQRSGAPLAKHQRKGPLAEKFELLTLYRSEFVAYMLAGEPRYATPHDPHARRRPASPGAPG